MNIYKGQVLKTMIRVLLYVSPFLFPLYLLKFEVYGIPFTVLECFIYILFSLWFYGIVLRKIALEWKRPLNYYWLSAFILFLGVTIGVLVSPHYFTLPSGEVMDAHRIALGVWKGWIIAPLLYFTVLTQYFKSKNDVKVLLRSFVFSGAFVALISYAMAFIGKGITYDLRLSGFFESANYLSLYLVPCILIGICFIIHRPHPPRTEDYFNFSSVVIMFHALIFTQSYAAVIAVFVSIVFYVFHLLFKKRVHIKSIIIGFLILTFTFSIIFLTQINTPKFKQFTDFENRSSSSVRLEIYEITAGLIGKNILTGIGPGLFQANYQIYGPDILGRAPMEWNVPHPHNIFLAFWINAGILGLLSLIIFVILAHTRFFYPVIALWGILIHGLFDTPFWKNDLSMIFWLILGSIVILQTYGTDSDKKRKAPIRKRLNPKLSNRTRS